MSATPIGTVSRSLPRRMLSLALAATVAPGSFAATHRAPAAAHHGPAARHAPAAQHAPAARAHVVSQAARGAGRTNVKPAAHTHANKELQQAAAASRRHAPGKEVKLPHSSRRDAIEAARAAVATARSSKPATRMPAQEEATADHTTQDRVHAWYKAHGTAATTNTAETEAPAAPRPVKAAKPKLPPASEPDLSPAPRKATLEDFQRAYQQKTDSMRAAAVENQSRTTADDDAVAASQIPSTAPTARVAAPFVHGDLLPRTAASNDAAQAPRQASLTAPKADRRADTRIETRTDADVLSASASAAATASPSRLKAISSAAASENTPHIVLPKPVAIPAGPAPAIATVKAAARKARIDPETVQGLTEETFTDNSDPVITARSAPALAARAGRAVPVAAQLVPGDDEDDSNIPAESTRMNLFDPHGRITFLPPMKGTHEILVHQNQMAVADGLDRIEDDDQLRDMRRYKLLVALPDNDAIYVDGRLPANRRFARPWSVRFLNDLSRAHYARFHTPLTITSAVRTVEFQKRLVRTNGNAAPPTGDIASPHLYGQAIDLGKHGMSVTEIAWMRSYLTPVEAAGKIDVEEEFQQACFHISIYRRYLGLPARKELPQPEPVQQRPVLQQAKAAAPTARHRRIPTAILATGLRGIRYR